MRINSADELEVCEEVGRGAFGIVYRGLIKSTNEEVAIKQIDLENEHADLIEVNKEIQIISECRIPQITQFKGCFVKQYKLWVIMEYVNGGSLFDLLRPGPVQNEFAISAIVKEILIALLYLHNQGKIHRDLKSQNILLNRLGEVKLTDFGVSTQLSSNFSRRNTTVGTPFWMAPEVILNNNGGHSFKADIWSLGCCSYELFTGKPPLQNAFTPMKALRQISKCQADQDFIQLIGLNEMTEISNCFKDFLYQCFLVDPKERSSAMKLLKHKFITQYSNSKSEANKSKELKKLITRKQLWDQAHHVSKVQNFYVPTEIKLNQNRWSDDKQTEPSQQNQPKTIHFDMSSIICDPSVDGAAGEAGMVSLSAYRDLTPPTSEGTGNSTPASKTTSATSTSTPPPNHSKEQSPKDTPLQLHYNSLTRISTRQENIKKNLQPELHKIINKVFYKLESKNNLLTSQYDSLVALNDNIISLVSFIQDSSATATSSSSSPQDKGSSPKVLICSYLRYFIKELMREGPSEGRTMLQKLIIPSVIEAKGLATISGRSSSNKLSSSGPTQFDEIEQSLMESWIEKMKE
ncbi:putative serine/threonine-protein kinase Sid1p [[Candida] railenensis]|uniref:non-specific serine/threonine protein kinase n=1 Tax=[Candida] railenensis TaxID=45579 RepID=A0A9P0QS31_9ASCO|nr:putative serine/threonine-protein kinase Sid1p [[Candida] railenensis]